MDIKIVKKAITGNKHAFSCLICEIKDRAYRIAYCYLKNEQDALDAYSNAILQSFRNIKNIKNPQFFSTWFIRILINECKKILQQNRKIVSFDELGDTLVYEDKYEDTDLKELLKEVPEIDRMIVYLKYYQEYSLQEISEILDMPLSTVKSKLYRQLKDLRKKLIQEEKNYEQQ